MVEAFAKIRNQDYPEFRIVIFIDDLDRCLPSAALDLIESIKSFMNIEGIIYVIGLNPASIKNIVNEKFGETTNIEKYDEMTKTTKWNSFETDYVDHYSSKK